MQIGFTPGGFVGILWPLGAFALSSTVWFDMSLLMGWQGSAEGIMRVEMEMANYLLHHPQNYTVRFFVYKPSVSVTYAKKLGFKSQALRLSGAEEISAEQVQAQIAWLKRYQTASKPALNKKKNAILSDVGEIGRRIYRGVKYIAISIPSRYITKKQKRIRAFLSTKPRLGNFVYRILTLFNNNEDVAFGQGDKIILIGAFWYTPFYIDYIEEIKKKQDIKFYCYIHDITPIVTPWLFSSVFTKQFEEDCIRLFDLSERIICVSKSTEKDIQVFAKKSGLEPIKTTVSISGCDSKKHLDEDRRLSVLSKFSIDKPYILFVSTFIPRKNHTLLNYAYQLLLSEKREDIPMMVWVGKVPATSERFFENLNISRLSDNGFLKILHDVSDNDLDLLYQQCQYTLYPSLYEGWGLPIAESLSYGKYCLCADNSSLPEVGQQFVKYLNAYDTRAWADAMVELQDKVYLDQCTDNIKKHYQPYTWNDSGRYLAAYLATC